MKKPKKQVMPKIQQVDEWIRPFFGDNSISSLVLCFYKKDSNSRERFELEKTPYLEIRDWAKANQFDEVTLSFYVIGANLWQVRKLKIEK